MIQPILVIVVAYLLGSVPTSVLVARRLGGLDIRNHGSRNAGASNVLRVIGWQAALPVLLLDVAKGALAIVVASRLPGDGGAIDPGWLAALAGGAAVAGHVWPVFARFSGGKGVATTAGIWLVLEPLALLIAVVVFALVVAATRWISLASIAAACSLPLGLYLLQSAGGPGSSTAEFVLAIGGALAIGLLHRANISRLIGGTEPRVG